ncbi:exodeoxyribonuclease VII large subunit [Aliidiomarina taiwanensis]|uniref:Exodeoxyribonuclease 7 large subunit n=1 Tax=Aliidiomarina taiwanensis TaxID=946228 RepID=A0A432X815_9GAMM|nr:exodeoxyribonuclease VII large subunit [Aliidiomarina taiwanensis]RUO42995.1 exodeoxyribonuclease VII large subunit [Aliidiomarina taiwanensis]
MITTPPAAAQRDIYTVTRLNREVRHLLEQQWGQVWLVGEVSNFSRPGSGHWYFSLKDNDAQISCAMFRGNNQRVRVPVNAGMQVMVRGRISLYEPRGNYQLIVEHLEPAGEGLLQQQFEALKRALAAEGLFAPERKKPLPERVRRLGVITSPSGAALHDVLSVLQRRDPSLHVIVYPAQVQGQEAPGALRYALSRAVQRNEVDALLITRGGGSLEDLWAFNDEGLARDIAACPLPTVSAVGHEVDFTIADFVADLRAATPSAAAELLSQDMQHYARHLQQLEQRSVRAWHTQFQGKQTLVRHLHARLQPLNPQRRIEQQSQQLDGLNERLLRSMQQRLRQQTQQHLSLLHRLQQQHPERDIQSLKSNLSQLQNRLQHAMRAFVRNKQKHFVAQQQALHIVSPLNTLARGYSMTFDEQQQLVRDATEVKPGQLITTRLGQGHLVSRVEQTHKD